MKKLFIVLLTSATLVIACRKPEITGPPAEPQLPPITKSGKNTFGCLVDGKVWLPNGAWLGAPIESQYNNGYFRVIGNQTNSSSYQSISLILWPIYKDSTITIQNYSISNSTQFFRFADVITSTSANNYYYPIGSPYTGELTILKLDTANRIMAGTFWFDAIDTVTNKTVQIREGRFDVRF